MIAGELHEIINDDTSNKNKLYLKKNVTVILFIKLVSFPASHLPPGKLTLGLYNKLSQRGINMATINEISLNQYRNQHSGTFPGKQKGYDYLFGMARVKESPIALAEYWCLSWSLYIIAV